jgi:membrane-associated phospholipid phosphatase
VAAWTISPERLARLLYPQTLAFVAVLTVALIALSVLVRLKATYALDLKVTKTLQETDSKIITKAARWATFMGNSLTLVILAAVTFGIAAYSGQGTAAVFTVASLLSLPINVLLKNIIDRARPGETEARILPGPRWGFSYPSGHSMGAAAFYGFVAVMIWLHTPDLPTRIALVVPFALLPIAVGLSRIYLGAHWFSDVIGGFAAGMVIVIILAVLYPV